MGKIKKLPPYLVAKISAGEVIERPVSVVRELVDNALDAGATQVKIEVEEGGMRKITVTDNGCGMEREDVKKCFEAHATSKIFTEEDLVNITSLGFRGEALSSIATAGRLTVKSKAAREKAGTLVYVVNGRLEDVSPLGMPAGTSVTVERIFSTMPARKKFLKTPAVEFRYIVRWLTQLALAYSKTSFTLYHNGNEVMSVPKDQSLADRSSVLLGERIATHLIPVSHTSERSWITGFIGKPQIAGHAKTNQYIFINGRPIKNKYITYLVKESYGTLIDPRTHPVFMLFLALPQDSVDVNVHPRKEEVDIADMDKLAETIRQAVGGTLRERDLTYHLRQDSIDSMFIVEDRGASKYGSYAIHGSSQKT